MPILRVALRALLLAAVLLGCRSREAPAPEASAAAPEPSAAALEPSPPSAGVAERPAGESTFPPRELDEAYEVSNERLRRATYLTRAVLILPGADDAMATLFSEAGVRFARLENDERFGQYAAGGVEEDEARPWLELCARALLLHSPALIRHSGTRFVVFCRGLRQGGQTRNSVPAGSAGTLLLDVEGFPTEDYFRRTLHHEIFHMIDFADGRSRADAEWTGLNPPGTRYGAGGRWSRDASNALGTGEAGFVTQYAEAAVEEDKAEIFRFLALSPGELDDLGQRDPVIADKRDLLLHRLAPYCDDYATRIVCSER